MDKNDSAGIRSEEVKGGQSATLKINQTRKDYSPELPVVHEETKAN